MVLGDHLPLLFLCKFCSKSTLILLTYLFNPKFNRENLINSETKVLLFLFGFILVFTAKWNIFIEESKWFTDVKQILV